MLRRQTDEDEGVQCVGGSHETVAGAVEVQAHECDVDDKHVRRPHHPERPLRDVPLLRRRGVPGADPQGGGQDLGGMRTGTVRGGQGADRAGGHGVGRAADRSRPPEPPPPHTNPPPPPTPPPNPPPPARVAALARRGRRAVLSPHGMVAQFLPSLRDTDGEYGMT
ncbi:hypothetical protein GCM10017687_26570 [Streptomyces echinatus]